MAKLKVVIKPGDRATFLGPNGEAFEIWIEKIDPERAAFLLSHLGVERKQKQLHINKLAATMIADNWDDLNGDTFLFDEEGLLLQGQHRCMSVIKSGRPIWVFAISNIKKDAIFGIDADLAVRTLGDLLGMLGEKYANDLAASMQILGRWKDETMSSYQKSLDNRSAYQLLKKHPSIRHSIAWCSTQLANAPLKLLPNSVLGWFHYVLTRIDAEKGLEFIEILTWQSEKRPDNQCPAFILRNRLEKSKKAVRRQDKLSTIERMAWAIKAWNLYVQQSRANTSIAIRWPAGEKWPSILDSEGEIFSYAKLKNLPKTQK